MLKEDIIRGLEGAMSKGETLERAMYSFYNAGYKREDVEEAARFMGIHLSQQESLIPATPLSFTVKPEQIKSQEMQVQIPQKKMEEIIPKPSIKPMTENISGSQINREPTFVQEVSRYEQKQKISPRTVLIIILSTSLLILLVSLGGLFIFKDAILNFFNGVF